MFNNRWLIILCTILIIVAVLIITKTQVRGSAGGKGIEVGVDVGQ